MTTIDHLGIKGIRSYGPDEESFIKFHRPLTIILGRNGSGKSTIIESVRMATTGELPPLVDKGSGFIHDPRIQNETETKARIRLRFSTLLGHQYIISRHFQLTIKRGPHGIGYKTEFKSLNQTLKRENRDGQNDDKSSKQEDINDQLPTLLRVSKPVLNNVIFVHQEESLWPLSDPKKVKEKFDEIFAATRYTKAMDVLRKTKTEQTSELRTIKVELNHYGEKVEQLKQTQRQVDEIRNEHDQLKAGVHELNTQITKLEQETRSAEQVAYEYNNIENQLAQKQTAAEHLESERANKFAEMTLHCPEMDEEALRTEIKRLEDMSEKADLERAERSRLIQSLSSEIEMKRTECSLRLSRKGMLEQLATQQRRRLEMLNDLKDQVSTDEVFSKSLIDNAPCDPLPDKEDNNSKWSSSLKMKQREASQYVKHVTETRNREVDTAVAELRDLQVRLQTARNELERNKTDSTNVKARLKEIRRELKNSERIQRNLKDSESRQASAQRQWQEKKNSSCIQELEDVIRDKRKQVFTVTEDIRNLRRVREELVQDQSERARYDMCKETLDTKKQHFSGKIDEFADTLLTCLRDLEAGEEEEIDDSTIRTEINRVRLEPDLEEGESWQELVKLGERIISLKDNLIDTASKHFHESSNVVNSTKMIKGDLKKQIGGLKRELYEIDRELNEAKKELSQVNCRDVKVSEIIDMLNRTNISDTNEDVEGEDSTTLLEKILKEVEGKTVSATNAVAQLRSGEELAKSDFNAFKEDPDHKCPACQLSHPDQINEIENNLKARIVYFQDPKNLKKAEKRVNRLSAVTDALKKLRTHNSSKLYREKNLDGVMEKYSAVQEDLEKYNKSYKAASERRNVLLERFGTDTAISTIKLKAVELNQVYSDIDNISDELKNIESNLSNLTQSDRSLNDVDREMSTLEEKVQQLQEEIERDRTKAQRDREDLQRAESRFHNLKQRYLEEKLQAENISKLKEEESQQNKSGKEIIIRIDELTSEMRKLGGSEKEAELGVTRAREESNLVIKEANSILSQRGSLFAKWNDCQAEIDSYIRSRKEEKLREITVFLENTQEEINSKSEDLRAHELEQQNASDSQTDMQSKIRNLKDNQRYRLIEEELKSNTRKIRHLKDQLDNLKQQSGEIPSRKVSRLTGELNEMKATKHATLGKQQAKTEQYKEKKSELTKAEKQGSRERYDEFRIQKQTMELASTDLERYRRALDEALMAYHTLKMENINRTIKELWHQTYRGNDIDEIEIVSDHGVPRGGVSDLRRSFNYRVQMRRGQATLDMRGRCSAGQKVLACLVIRLALAESFCTNCGILALDEPTTNLDRENIESLAGALRTIIENRKHQKNFQLIMITHDQEFIELIGAREFCSEYYTIYKDASGLSKTQVNDLQEIM